jgi:hypothetical protein
MENINELDVMGQVMQAKMVEKTIDSSVKDISQDNQVAGAEHENGVINTQGSIIIDVEASQEDDLNKIMEPQKSKKMMEGESSKPMEDQQG